MNPQNKQTLRVGGIEVDPLSGSCRRNGKEIYIREQALQVFCYLIEHRAETVTKEALIENVWQGTAVTDDALVQCIVEIRKALGDDSRHPRFIKTVPKIGYRFIATVEEGDFKRVTTVETEEVTSIRVEEEEEEEDDHHEIVVSRTAKRLPWHRAVYAMRVALIVGVFLLLAAGLGLHFYQKFSKRAVAGFSLNPISGKKPIAVMFFEDRTGSAHLDWLREGLPDMLISDLSRSPQLAVLSRQQLHQLLQRMDHKAGTAIDFEEALEIARKTHAQLLITGSFTRVDDKIRVEVQLHDVSGGPLLTAEHFVVDSPEQILTQIDLVSLKLKKQLGVLPLAQEPQTKLGEVMTKNLEAYRYYSLALEKAQGLENREAIALLERAVALDPDFAMAHARIGYAYAVTWNFAEQAQPHLERAFKLSDRLRSKDKLYISGWYAIANLDFEQAISVFRRIVAEYPMDIEAYQRLGSLLHGAGRFGEALEIVKQGLILDPEAKELYNLMGGIYLSLGSQEQGIAAFQRYVNLAPGEPNAFDSLGLGYQWAGRYQEAIEAYLQALALKPDFEVATIHLGNAYFQQGQYQAALQQFQRYIQIAPTALEKARGWGSVAYVYLKRKDLAKADAAARREAESEKAYLRSSLMLALERGQVSLAGSLANQLVLTKAYTHRGMQPPPREAHYLEGALKLAQSQPSEALELLKKALKFQPLIWHHDSFEDCLARAYLKLGALDQAIAELDRILKLNPNYPLAHFHLAQAYEQKGQAEKARELYRRFLEVWKNADPDLPEVITAKSRLSISS